MVAPAVVLGLRGVQVLFSIIVLGLTAYIVDAFTNPWGSWSPHSLNFMLFTSVWTLLATAYLTLAPTRLPKAAHSYAIAGVEFITMIFWFAAWVAVAALWGDITWVDTDNTYYGCGVAAIVFGAIVWLTFLATTVLAALHIRNNPRSNAAAPPPDMTGV